MEKTTVEQLIEDCYRIAQLGNINYNMEISLTSDGQFRVAMYYDSATDNCFATALTQLKENLTVRAKPVIEKNLANNKSMVEHHNRSVEAYLKKVKDSEDLLQSL